MRTRLVLDLLAGNRAEAFEYLRTVRERMDTLLRLEKESNA
jgi:hypothetical protein